MEKKKERQEKIKSIYGQRFTQVVGIENISSLVEMSAAELNLENDDTYPSNTVKPYMMKELSAVRGIMGSSRPFIAIKIEMLHRETKDVVAVVVEFIFMRYVIDNGESRKIFENNYVTATNIIDDKGHHFLSNLYSSGSMSVQQMEAVRDLLEGKEILAPKESYIIRKA